MAEVKSHKYHMLPIQKALRGYQIKSGFDAVGCLFIMASDPVKRLSTGVITKPVSWWCGTILDLKETRRLGIKYAGPTTVQVAISICSVLKWMVKHPKNGVCFPEDLPFEEILNNSKPFLGEIFSGYVPFHPASTRFEDICCE